MINHNPLGLIGIEFVEFASPHPKTLESLFFEFGFSKTKTHGSKNIDYFRQNDIHFMINSEKMSAGVVFSSQHGPSICSMGWKFRNPHEAYELALTRGATPANQSDYFTSDQKMIPAIQGIGGSLIYFVGVNDSDYTFASMGFKNIPDPITHHDKGFLSIDHLTNNVEFGTMQTWANFYKSIFGFTEVRYFDIRGLNTGLTSYALKSPCGTFCIPITVLAFSILHFLLTTLLPQLML